MRRPGWSRRSTLLREATDVKDLSDSRILIVDDAKANVDVLVEALRGEYKLSVALDGAAALRSIEKNVPDLVLLDIMMPGVDGYEVCRQLRASESTRGVPVMFLSALEDVTNKARGFEVGGNDYLTKPFEVLEVKARVRSLLKAKAYSDAVREAMARDLRIASEIQMGILPADLAAATKGTGLVVHAAIEPARQVGGDLYEVLRASPHRVVVALGDVSGKGIPAALFMAVAVTVLRTLARQIAEPDEILRRVNDELAEQNPRGMFVTMQCLVFDTEQRRVSCAGAGHHSLAILSPGCPPRLAFPSSGRPAGLMPFNPIERETMSFGDGDTFVLFSDGVSEAMNEQDDFYGEERLLAALAAAPGARPAEIVSRVLADVRAFTAGAKQSDDITILVAQYAPLET
jgi:sigma-B regulation protein RsbU (phosphoserine phosphatase)